MGTPQQAHTIDSMERRYALSIVHANSHGDLHVQVIGGRRAWFIATDGRAVSAPRREGRPL